VHPHPATLTSKGSTSTDVLKSLSSGCSMFPLRKKNLQTARQASELMQGWGTARHTAQDQQRKG
jgi:hypothetical protein